MTNSAPDQTVGQAVQDFYIKYNYGEEGGIHEKYAWMKFGFLSIPVPNVDGRRKHVYLHDINHIITGNDTTWKGESAISAWEIASGGWKNIYVIWIMAIWAMGVGVLLYPRNTLKAFKQGLTMKNAATCGLTKTDMYKLRVTELRNILSNQPASNSNPFVWMAFSVLFFALPFITGIALIRTIVHFF
jgi:hypothetical protein